MKEQALAVGDVAAHLLDGVPLCGVKASALLTGNIPLFYSIYSIVYFILLSILFYLVLFYSILFYIMLVIAKYLLSSVPLYVKIAGKPIRAIRWPIPTGHSHYALLVYCVSFV
jgi:hypothetical protein